MKKNDSSSGPVLSLKEENELKKMRMCAQYGAVFPPEDPVNPLPPEIEFRFLEFVEAIEKATASAEKKSIHNLLGQPPYHPESCLQDDQIESELKRLKDCLKEKNIELQVPEWFSKREEYKFITEELFPYKMRDMGFGGITHTFNLSEADISRTRVSKAIEDLIKAFIARDRMELEELFPGQADDLMGKINRGYYVVPTGIVKEIEIRTLDFAGEKIFRSNWILKMKDGSTYRGNVILEEKNDDWFLKYIEFK